MANLVSLSLMTNRVGVEGARALVKMENLVSLNLGINRLRDDEMREILGERFGWGPKPPRKKPRAKKK